MIAEHAPGAPPEFITTFGLTRPGASVVMKVYVISETDNSPFAKGRVITRRVDGLMLRKCLF